MASFTKNHPLKIIFKDQGVQNKKVQGYGDRSVIISAVGHTGATDIVFWREILRLEKYKCTRFSASFVVHSEPMRHATQALQCV